MKTKLENLIKQCNTQKQVEEILKKNNISYSLVEGFSCKECVIKEDDKTTHRILCKKGKIELKTMIKHTIEITSQDLFKIDYVKNHCKY